VQDQRRLDRAHLAIMLECCNRAVGKHQLVALALRDHEFNLVHQELERFDGIVDSPERSRKFKAIRTESSIRSEGAPSTNHADMFFLDPNWANRGEQPWLLIFRATPAMSQGRNHRCQRRLARSRRRMEIFRWQ
jgi:hypothetical protein